MDGEIHAYKEGMESSVLQMDSVKVMTSDV